MLYPLFRLLRITLYIFVFVYLALYVNNAHAVAADDYHDYSGEAATHCEQARQTAWNNFFNNTVGGDTNWTLSDNTVCNHVPNNKQWICWVQASYNGTPQVPNACNNFQFGGSSVSQRHFYTYDDPVCEAGQTGVLITGLQEPPSWCDGSCEWEATTGSCDSTQCYYDAESTGETCNTPPPPGGDIPEGCSLDAFGFLTCDCSSNPNSAQCVDPDTPDPELPPNCIRSGNLIYCADTDPPDPGENPDYGDPDVPPQNPPPNTPPVGDGDPSTPCTGDQCGDGDTDEDGDRDVDCNPQSNPDCQYTSNALGSGSCDAAPVCSGDPVGCAILYQEWASMCYGNGSASNTVNCDDVTIDCDGDLMLCEILYQQKKFHCDLFHGSSGFDTNPFDDSDFNYDPKDSAEVVDVVTDFDQSGFAAGSCPADIPVATAFGSYNVSFQLFCDLADIIRAMVILSALIGGALIVSGSRT